MSISFKSACFGLLCVLCLSSASAQTLQDYWTVDEYVTQNPVQKDLMDGLSKRVRDAPQPWTGHLKSPVKIAAVYPALQSSDYWRRSLKSFEQRMDDITIPFETQLFASSPSDSLEVQKQQLTEALAWDPDYLVFTLDVLRHQNMIERVLLRGKPKLILQNMTTPLRNWGDHQPFLYVGFDHALGTQKLAAEYIRQTGGKGEYLMLYFTRGFVSIMRGDTFQNYVSEHSDMTMVDSYFTDGDQEKARKSVLDAITRNPNLRYFYACSTDVALGTLKALDELGLTDEALVNGWGGGDAELSALKQGKLDFTIMRMNDDNGVAMAEAIRMDLSGQRPQVPTIFSGDMELITQHTSTQHIDNLIAHAFRYSGIPK
jgi:autoinducer 2-binding protein LuxP